MHYTEEICVYCVLGSQNTSLQDRFIQKEQMELREFVYIFKLSSYHIKKTKFIIHNVYKQVFVIPCVKSLCYSYSMLHHSCHTHMLYYSYHMLCYSCRMLCHLCLMLCHSCHMLYHSCHILYHSCHLLCHSVTCYAIYIICYVKITYYVFMSYSMSSHMFHLHVICYVFMS